MSHQVEQKLDREEGAKVSKWAVGKCGIASGRAMPFAHERRHDETSITDFGAAPVHDRGDTGCQCLDLVQKQPQPNLRFGES